MAETQSTAALISSATGSEVLVTINGFTAHVPLAVAQSFATLSAWWAVQFPQRSQLVAGDKAGLTTILAGLGITMGA